MQLEFKYFQIANLITLAQNIEELQRGLTKKDEDMRAMEERYKTYLEKARNVSAC